MTIYLYRICKLVTSIELDFALWSSSSGIESSCKLYSARETPPARLACLDTAFQDEQHEHNHTPKKISVIERLPYEVLASIFEDAHSPDSGLELLWSQVSSQWRSTAIATPILWRTIQLLVDRPDQFELATLYLARSKATPIDITVTQGPDDSQHAVAYGKLLCDHIHHCRQLKFCISSLESAGIILGFLVMASAPLLQSFDAHLPSGYQPADQILMGGTPMLAVMHLRASASFLPPLHTVTSLHIHNIRSDSRIELQHWRDLLSSLPHLISLVINGNVVVFPVWTSGPSVTLPALRTLEITIVDMEESESGLLRCLYDTIDAPLLECLSLHNYIDRDLAFLEDSWHFGVTKFPALDTLILSGLDDGEDACFAHFMRAFPHAQTVIFKGSMMAHFYELLNLLPEADGSQPRYWPRLRHLTAIDLQYADRHEMNELLATCLASRIAMGKPIETLTLTKTDIDRLPIQSRCLCHPTAAWMDLVKVVEYEREDKA
ncbi:hypothetical protein HWV62_41822 [Athelia sp. TMB]|nr:hypothetical protein HWV62_41822 [Athelia sp. TMB]